MTAQGFAPDARQSEFTTNAAQRVDPLLASQLQESFHDLAARAAPGLLTSLGCHDGDECAKRFISDFVTRAWRRPLAPQESSELLDLFRTGATGAGFVDGVSLVIEAALQAASFLYVTELGVDAARDGEVRLGAHETAAALAYLLTGGPPDAVLMTEAARNGLSSGSDREAQARRLLQTEGAKHQVQRLVTEWLGMDRLAVTSKDNDVYPEFEPYRPYLVAETNAFISEVVFNDAGTIARLLTADYTMAEAPLARYYDLPPPASPGARTNLGHGPRRGLLTHGTFQSVHAHPDSSAPVKRGVAVLERLLCTKLPSPAELSITVAPPRPDPTRTTRARFEAHTSNPACASCHAIIDPIGFAFEAFDGMGTVRSVENGQPVVTASELAAGGLTGHVNDAAALVDKLAASPETNPCLARNFFRFAAAETDDRLEEEYLRSVWTPLPDDRRGNIKDLFVSWVASDMFVARTVAP